MQYEASWDKSVKIITIGVTALFIGLGLMDLFPFSEPFDWKKSTIITSILIVTYVGAYIFRPLGYTLTAVQVIIRRPWRSVILERKSIETVQIISKDQLKFTIRTFGVGGLFGYYGKFYNSVYGKMTWYLTRRDHLVLIRTVDKKTILLSPDDIDSFAKELESNQLVLS
nr:PH domain-containing protein [uncultured Dyadobacter sp.]